MNPRQRALALASSLESIYHAYDRPAVIDDPIECVRPYADLRDREIAGFLAAGLAFGNVKAVMQSVRTALAAMGPSPAEFVGNFSPSRDAHRVDYLVHRWTRGDDIVALCVVLREILRTFGSIEGAVAHGMREASNDIGDGLDALGTWAAGLDVRDCYPRRTPRHGVMYFFPKPAAGSACKRLNLYLRWMVRRDRIDPGGWTRIAARHLVVPLDVHIIRVGTCLGLTRRASPGWAMAREITDALRAVDPADPVRFDFALCHLGMQGLCGHGRPQGDADCPMRGVCRPRRTAGARRVARAR
jgi:uncharacterized protein (TIGR02757 family)